MLEKRSLALILIIVINLNLLFTYTIIFNGVNQKTFEKLTGAANQGQVSICVDQALELINPSPLTARAGKSFQYDINITNEAAYSTLNFSDNTSLFNIQNTTGIINFTPSEANVGTHYIGIFIGNLACEDPDDQMILNLTINSSNNAPTIDLPEIFNLTEDVAFLYNFSIFASDPDLDSLKFFDNTSMFVIGEDNGIVSFTPTNANVGKNSVRVSVVDPGFLTDFDDTVFNVTNVNDPPNLTLIGVQTKYFNQSFTITLEGIDVDVPENLTFSSNTSWFLNVTSRIPTTNERSAFNLTFNITDSGLFNGTHSINVTVNDTFGLEDSEVFTITFLFFNHPPNITLFTPGKTITVTQGQKIDFGINKIDEDGTIPTTRWYVNDIFTGETSDNYTFDSSSYSGAVNVSVIITDGEFNDSESAIVTVNVPPPAQSRPDTGGFSSGPGLRLFCDELWICTDWSECPKSEIQIRECNDIKKCGTTKYKPNLTQPCIYVDIPSCFDKVRNQGEVLPDCGGPCTPCPTCDDGIKNHNEEDIDCGGPCKPCKELRQAAKPEQITFGTLKEKKYWWFWLLILLTVLVLLFIARHKIERWMKNLTINIRDWINIQKVNKLIKASKKALLQGQPEKAKALYEQANVLYKKLPKQMKLRVKLEK